MPHEDPQWESAVGKLWAEIDRYDEAEFRHRMDVLVAELPPKSPLGMFEQGSAWDSTGHPDQAVPLYAAAIEAGLEGTRRRQAVIQMASSIRNLGDPRRALTLLTAEAERTSDELDAAVATFMALALADLGREREGLAVALTAISKYLPRYNRSVARYAQELASPTTSAS
ncbi:MAG: tetratricopeptide repeat protein [Candidatus Dormibacteraeota bacterium]|nr:tetratricopeptide repeat protein [Candidatus Dormibacteraeota bacterium]